MRLLVKGADDVIASRLSFKNKENEATQRSIAHLNEFAQVGYRTLAFAYRDLDEREFNDWVSTLEKSQRGKSSRDKRVII